MTIFHREKSEYVPKIKRFWIIFQEKREIPIDMDILYLGYIYSNNYTFYKQRLAYGLNRGLGRSPSGGLGGRSPPTTLIPTAFARFLCMIFQVNSYTPLLVHRYGHWTYRIFDICIPTIIHYTNGDQHIAGTGVWGGAPVGGWGAEPPKT